MSTRFVIALSEGTVAQKTMEPTMALQEGKRWQMEFHTLRGEKNVELGN